jgi:ribosomal protein L29
MTAMQDIHKKSDKELAEIIEAARETIRAERFKDRFSRKASVTKNAKLEIARALTELNARRRNPDTK